MMSELRSPTGNMLHKSGEVTDSVEGGRRSTVCPGILGTKHSNWTGRSSHWGRRDAIYYLLQSETGIPEVV